MDDMTFPTWPSFTEEEGEAVKKVLLSNRVNAWTGDTCHLFEQAFADWIGVQHAIAVMNGTVALELALRGLGVGPGDEVIVTPRSFMASVSCIIAVGATPVFADVDRDSQNITAKTIQPVLSSKTRAIICVHLAGWPCEMDEIMALAKEQNIFVIEDCAQAHGAQYKGQSVGSIGDVAAWSFCQDKIMTTGGEGGMVTTNNKALWSRMWSYKDHGKSWDNVFQANKKQGFQWVCDTFGTNWRMTEMQAAIGLIQLGRMPKWHAVRLENLNKLYAMAEDIPGIRVPRPPQYSEHGAYKAYVFLVLDALTPGWHQTRVMARIQANNVPCSVGSCPEIYAEKAFDGTNWRPKKPLPTAEVLGATSLMFPVHPTLNLKHMVRMGEVLKSVMQEAASLAHTV